MDFECIADEWVSWISNFTLYAEFLFRLPLLILFVLIYNTLNFHSGHMDISWIVFFLLSVERKIYALMHEYFIYSFFIIIFIFSIFLSEHLLRELCIYLIISFEFDHPIFCDAFNKNVFSHLWTGMYGFIFHMYDYCIFHISHIFWVFFFIFYFRVHLKTKIISNTTSTVRICEFFYFILFFCYVRSISDFIIFFFIILLLFFT